VRRLLRVANPEPEEPMLFLEEESFFNLPEWQQEAHCLCWQLEGRLPGLEPPKPRRCKGLNLEIVHQVDDLFAAFRPPKLEEEKRWDIRPPSGNGNGGFWQRVRKTGRGWLHFGKWRYNPRVGPREDPYRFRVVRIRPEERQALEAQQELFERRAGLQVTRRTVCPKWRAPQEHLWRFRTDVSPDAQAKALGSPELGIGPGIVLSSKPYQELDELLRAEETKMLGLRQGNPSLFRKFQGAVGPRRRTPRRRSR